jgi:hypothetical protein
LVKKKGGAIIEVSLDDVNSVNIFHVPAWSCILNQQPTVSSNKNLYYGQNMIPRFGFGHTFHTVSSTKDFTINNTMWKPLCQCAYRLSIFLPIFAHLTQSQCALHSATKHESIIVLYGKENSQSSHFRLIFVAIISFV